VAFEKSGHLFFVNMEKMEKKGGGFHSLGIKASILSVLDNLGYTIPTPIQEKAIPAALAGNDLIGIAQTGTGKTLAFGIPMLERLATTKGQGLVVVPTRELALQVAESIKRLGIPFGLRTAVLIGGEGIDKQLFLLRKKPHIIVATPGRLIDHLKRRTFKMDAVSVIVLDEADMMFDLGFAPQMEEILKMAPTDRQTMLFSATMPVSIAKLAAKHLKLPISIEVAPQGTTAEKVDQEVIIVRASDRFYCLENIINGHEGSILVFVRTKHGVKDVTKKLVSLGHSALEIHSNLSQARRRSTLESFKSHRTRILVATDVAARGLDVNGIELVVNYNLPDAYPDYVHRIGRTGRAGNKGKAISLATPDQMRDIAAIEKLIDKKIPIRKNAQSEAFLVEKARPSEMARISERSRTSERSRASEKPLSTKKSNSSVKPNRSGGFSSGKKHGGRNARSNRSGSRFLSGRGRR